MDKGSWYCGNSNRGSRLESVMPSPYGLEIVDSCLRCKLRAGRPFCDLPRPTLEALQTIGFTAACPKGTVLFAQGQSSREISVLCVGHVKVSTTSPHHEILCLGIVGAGTVLGLTAAISGRPHEVTIQAVEPCQLKVIKKDRFLNLLRKDESACLGAVRCLSADVWKTDECVRLFGLSQSKAERLARVLVNWDMREGDELKGRLRLRFPFTHRELAEMLGITREYTTRLLRTFEHKKIIRRRGSSLIIQDERALLSMAKTA
jgi:CRP/FNR family transcriptional regulator, cyclic AMP receptor protein